MSISAVVLLSGGLDSVYNLYRAYEEHGEALLALSLNYGQKAFKQELKAAQYFADELKVSLQTLDISNVFTGDESSLTSSNEIPTDEVDIESYEKSVSSAKKVWVANRNGVLINVAACIAEKNIASYVIPGFNLEEAETFPDNSEDYIQKINETLRLSTSNSVQVKCYSQRMNKKQMVADALERKINLDKIWSCYYGGETPCGKCESCQRLRRAIEENS